ncbi:hypothetical protein FDP22_02510 [Paroceanicella profunda]|uniref:DUF1134 domain-containing protein n=1 Tax=Paroceanicella profunda TaxID=2579971 RepID=A0A5B8FGE5_9RHOB|nr:hypothetical protein [Paroceanicella profunda]QDL90758.1 hypothetical protein FDP22_02510 [Paroceanicella profunda]
MRHICLAAAVLLAAPLAASADEISDSIEAALAAYNGGDVAGAKDELDYASQLLGQMKAQGMTDFLPPARDGWEREVDEPQSAAAFGGGVVAGATYTNGSDDVTVQLMADNAMVASMGAMFGSTAMMGSMGRLTRIGGEKFVSADGQITGFIGGRVLVQVSGSAPEAEKVAYLEMMDFDALKDF